MSSLGGCYGHDMRKARLVVVLGLVAAGLQVLAPAGPVHAAGVSCQNGLSAITSPYTVSIDGVAQTATEPGRYGKFYVLVCKDTNNKDYTVLAGNYNAGTSGGQDRFTTADLNTQFTVSFLPDANTKPLVAQGHGVISSYTVDANDSNRVTITTKPLAYSDIYGSDCGNAMPSECVLAVKTSHGDRASADNIEIRIGIRYTENGQTAPENFDTLQGMYWSSAAYYFWMHTMCPTSGATTSAISIEVGGPHLKADGTQNFGNVNVFIPASAVIACFGAPPSIAKDSLAITRTENGTTTDATTGSATDVGLQYTVSADDATGLTITIPQVTFSKPTYKVATKSGKSLAKKTKTYASLLQLAVMKKPAGGSYKVTSKSTKVCAGALAKVYAYKAGTCKVSVATFNKSGKKVATKTVTFKVGA